jgi:lethal(2) giant larvae protein
MYLIFEVKTNTIFVSLEGDEMDFDDAAFSEFQWPPYRKVGSYDPYDDDNRLSIRMIDFCPYMCKLCVAGEGGQVLTFAFNSSLAEVRVEYVTAEIFVEEPRDMRRGRGGGLRDSSPLECKTDFIQFPAGFQPSLCVQCLPALPITAMAFRPSWGLVGAGNSKGFMVANFYTKSIVLNHPTVLSDGIEVRNITRVQSMRRSLRSSLRRRSNSAVSEEKRKITATFNLETDGPNEGSPKKNNRRAHSVDDDLSKVTTSSPVIVMGVPPEQRGVVNYLVFAETHISGGGPHVSIIATTMGSSLIRYSIEVPKSDLKYTTHNRAFPAGKDYALVHAAPIVAVFVLDHDSQPLPSPSEVEQRAAPTPNMASPHYALIVTQEQIKVQINEYLQKDMNDLHVYMSRLTGSESAIAEIEEKGKSSQLDP